MRFPICLAATVLVAAVLAGCTTAEPSPAKAGATATTDEAGASVEPAQLTVLSPTATVELQQEVAPFAVAEAMGYLKDESLTVTTQNVDGSTAALQALATGGGDIALAGAEATVAAVSEGVDIKIFGALTVNFPYLIAVPADSDVQSAADLAGGSIGVISLASASYPFALGVLEDAGLDPETDVDLVPLGGATTAAAALESGEVDALAYFTRAYAGMENSGLELRYLENPDIFDDLFSVVLTTTTDMLEEQPDVVARYGRATYRSMLFAAANPEAAVRIAYAQYPELVNSDPDEQIEADVRSFGAYLLSTLPVEGAAAADVTNWGSVPAEVFELVSGDYPWGALEDERLDAVQDFAVTAGTIDEKLPVEDVWDPSLIERMNDWDRAEVLADAESWAP